MNDIFDRCWPSNDGPLVQKFEARVAEHLGVKHCVAMCNGTIAPGLEGEVIVPSYTFVATAHALQWQGLVLPHTEQVAGSVIVLPTVQTTDADKIGVVAQVVRTVVAGA